MKTGRVTIAGLLALIAACAVGAAALKNPTVLWAQFMLTLALTSLLFATLAAIVGRTERSFAIGFAVIGWSYMLLSLGPWFGQHWGPWLLSSRVADESYVRLFEDDQKRWPTIVPGDLDRGDMMAGNRYQWRFARYLLIAHSLFAIGHGVTGGCVALWLRRKPTSDGPGGTS